MLKFVFHSIPAQSISSRLFHLRRDLTSQCFRRSCPHPSKSLVTSTKGDFIVAVANLDVQWRRRKQEARRKHPRVRSPSGCPTTSSLSHKISRVSSNTSLASPPRRSSMPISCAALFAIERPCAFRQGCIYGGCCIRATRKRVRDAKKRRSWDS